MARAYLEIREMGQQDLGRLMQLLESRDNIIAEDGDSRKDRVAVERIEVHQESLPPGEPRRYNLLLGFDEEEKMSQAAINGVFALANQYPHGEISRIKYQQPIALEG